MISVEYGDAKDLSRKHRPKGLNVDQATPIQGIEMERKEFNP